MKKHTTLALLLLLFYSCSKDGHMAHKIIGVWSLDAFYENDVLLDIPCLDLISVDFKSNGTHIETTANEIDGVCVENEPQKYYWKHIGDDAFELWSSENTSENRGVVTFHFIDDNEFYFEDAYYNYENQLVSFKRVFKRVE